MNYTKLLFTALLLALSAINVNAASVTMQSSWSHIWGGPQINPLPFVSLGAGNLVFTYDDQTADTSPYSNRSIYANPFLSGTFSFASKTFTFDTTQTSSITIWPLKGSGVNVQINAVMSDGNGGFYNLSLGIESNTSLPSGSLSNMEGQRCNDACGLFISPINNSQVQTMLLDQLSPLTSVPVPAAAWLFGSGLIGLFGAARRRK